MIVVHEQSIYEARGGVTVSTGFRGGSFIEVLYPNTSTSYTVYWQTGRVNAVMNEDDPRDLVREIVVGSDWNPHNGGPNPAPGMRVDVVHRDTKTPMVCGLFANDYQWGHAGEYYDIVAWREAADARQEVPLGLFLERITRDRLQ